DGEHDTLELVERRKADAERRVVRDGGARLPASAKERGKIGRRRPDVRDDPNVADRVETRQMLADPPTTAFDGDRLDRNAHAADLARRPPCEMDLDRCKQLAAAEFRPSATAAQQRLVDVVVEDRAEPLEVV